MNAEVSLQFSYSEHNSCNEAVNSLIMITRL